MQLETLQILIMLEFSLNQIPQYAGALRSEFFCPSKLQLVEINTVLRWLERAPSVSQTFVNAHEKADSPFPPSARRRWTRIAP